MAPKQAEKIVKNLPMATSSEEEEDDSGSLSAGEESYTCGEVSQTEESYVTPIALKYHKAKSEEAEPSKKKKKGQNTYVTKDRPESSVAKRSLENAKGKVQMNNKKLKRQIIEHKATKEEVKKTPLFTNIFSHPTYEVIREETNVVSTPLPSGSEILSFLKKENVFSNYTLDESFVIARLDMVEDGPKRMMAEKVKIVEAMRVELCLQRIQLIANVANLISSGNPSPFS